MKLANAVVSGIQLAVAPRAGAWIETSIFRNTRLILKVAPRAGAWIETVS